MFKTTQFNCSPSLSLNNFTTVEPLLRGHPNERPPPLERPIGDVNLDINILISTPDERPTLSKGHFSDAKGVASQEGFHCSLKVVRQSREDFTLYLKCFLQFVLY